MPNKYFKTILSLGVVAVAAVVLYAYWGGLYEVVNRWNKQEEYSHGYFIPLIAAWFMWKRWDALKQSVGAGRWHALLLMLMSAILLLVGEISALFVLVQLSFLLAITALIIAYGGNSLFRVAGLPVLFLIFAIPLPYFIDAQFSWYLQLASSKLGVVFLRLLGLSVFLEGNVIDLGVYKLQVVEACSGLRYLYPLLSIGFLAAYMYKGGLKQRVTIFISTVPITVLMNSMRIAVVGILVNQWGSNQADGFIHYFEGWVVFMLCLAILMAEIWVFEFFGQKRNLLDVMDVPVVKPVRPAAPQRNPNFPLFAVLIVLVLASVMASSMGGREELHPKRQTLTVFPTKLGEWVARDVGLSQDVESALGLDDYILADYDHPQIGHVNFYVAYYGSQRKGNSPHSPRVCMPGGGWEITSLERRQIEVAGFVPFEVNRTVIEKNGQRQVVYYWFMERGKPVADEYAKKWYLLYDALVLNRTDGALVRITAPVVNDMIDSTDERIRTFIQASMPHLGEFLPE